MKGKFIITAVLVMALSLPILGCSAGVQGNNAAPQQKSPEGSQQQSGQQGSAAQGTGNEITIIAKSGNQQPGDEKEAVLDEITRELDEILSSANSLDEVAETDLN